MASLHTLEVHTHQRNELLDITDEVSALVKASGVQAGLCTVYCPHTTGAITVNENADPHVQEDLLAALERIVPNRGFKHAEGNSDAHVKTSLVGPSVTILVEGGALKLGTWQGIYFCEFDGPRKRKAWVQILP